MARLKDLDVTRVSFVGRGSARDPADTTDTQRHLVARREDIGRAEWTQAEQNDLPDSAFAVIAPGGTKDSDGKTVPRSLRSLPYRGPDGAVDLPHLRNALSRLPQTDLPPPLKAKAAKVLQAAAKTHLKSELQRDSATAWDELPEDVKGAIAEIAEFAQDNGATNEDDDNGDKRMATDDTKTTKDEGADNGAASAASAAPAAAAQGESTTPPAAVDKTERVSLTRAEHAALMARIAKSEADAKQADEIARAERDLRVTREFTAKAEALPYIPGTPEQVAKAMREIAEKAPDAWAFLEPTLSSVNATLSRSEGFKVYGAGAGPDANSPVAQLTAKAEEIRKAEPELTKEQAMSRAMRENQALAIEARRVV